MISIKEKLELELGCCTLIIDEDRANNLLRFMVMMIERLVADPGITLEDMTSYKIFTPMVDGRNFPSFFHNYLMSKYFVYRVIFDPGYDIHKGKITIF
jgi:hypothetical protein